MANEECEMSNFVFDNCSDFGIYVKGKKTAQQNVRVLHINIRSVRKNWTDLQTAIQVMGVKWDLILLSEVGIKKEETDLYKLENYDIKWITRENTKIGGGLAILLHEDICASCIVHFFKIEENDAASIEIKCNLAKYKVIYVYRQPNTDVRTFLKEAENALKLEDKIDEVIWIGDINIDILEDRERKKKNINGIRDKYENMMANLGYEPKIISITREEKKGEKMTKSCIDHVYVKTKNKQSKGFVISEKIADHYMVGLLIENEKLVYEEQEIIKKVIKDKKVIKELKEINWDKLDKFKDPDVMYDEIEKTIREIYEKFTTVKKGHDKNKKKHLRIKKDWVKDNNLKDITKKNKLWKQIRKFKGRVLNSQQQKLIEEYRVLKNKIRSDLEKNKQTYLKNQITKEQNMWESINKITGKRKTSIDETILKNFKGIEIKNVRNEFNASFAGQVERLKNKYNRNLNSRIGLTVEQNEKRKKTQFVRIADEKTFIKIIEESKDTDAVGRDEFNLNNFKKSKENTAKFLTKLTNAIIETEIWPKKLKIQVIRPIYKKGRKKDMENYRPISILPIINKFIEKFFETQLQTFFKKWHVIIKEQYGFQKGKGTNEALKHINEKISKALDKGKYVGATFIDLQKAFDTVNRERLKKKLQKYGLCNKFCGILNSYLDERLCCVKIGNAYSECLTSKEGVPQGSVLGPLLFLIYINDINEENELTLTIFADDILLLNIENTKKEMLSKMQTHLNIIQKWCEQNKLYINENKTKIMFIRATKKENLEEKLWMHTDKCNKTMCESTCVEIKQTENIKYLGVEVDCKWKFKIHIDNVIKKIRQIMPKLYSVKKLLGVGNKKIIYDAWIKSQLQYAIEIYGLANKTDIDRLQKIQNKVIKTLFANRFCHSAKELYKKLNILKIDQLRKYVIIIKNFFRMKATREEKISKKQYNTKNTFFLPVQISNNYGSKQAEYYIPELLNKIPNNFWSIGTYGELKKKSSQWLINAA